MNFKDEIVYTNNNTKSDDTIDKFAPNRVKSRHSINYTNPRTGKTQTQNYLDMNDIVVPLLIKKGSDGQIYFAMEYTYIPARKQIYLELPSIGMEEEKDSYSDSDILTTVTNLTDILQLTPTNGNINNLSTNYEPVSQSFINQTAKILELGVKNEQGDKRIHWFPISCLHDMLSRTDIPMSLQTKYALLLFADKHKSEIAKIDETKADVDLDLLSSNKSFGSKDDDEVIWPHKYRFGVAKEKTSGDIQDLKGIGKIDYASENIEDDFDGVSKETSVYGMSKNSIQCVITRINNGKVQVGLMPQHRSPFVAKEKIKEIFIETPAGMIDENDYNNTNSDEIAGKNAAVREVAEEAKIKIFPNWLIQLSQDLLLSHGAEELSKFYLVKLPKKYEQLEEEKQDEQEAIGKLQWYDIDTLDIDNLHAPMPTKISLLMARNYLQREKEKENAISGDR